MNHLNWITLLSLGLGSVSAKEYTVVEESIDQVETIDVISTPEKGTTIAIAPKKWKELIVEKVVPNGAKVSAFYLLQQTK